MDLQQWILNTAQKALGVEAEVLAVLAASLGSDFVQAVRALSEIQGRMVLTGVGKSAIVAQKIAATMNSTGTPALYMHAGDAVHGDLGMITQGDALCCLSKSGETSELKVLLPLVRMRNVTIVGLHCREGSFLHQNADFPIHIPVAREADPHDLAPTASTTAQMAVGDALAICLMGLKGFTPDDFSRFHPGGSLGKKLYLRVSDLYTQNERPQVKPEDDLREIIVAMTSGRLGVAVVVDGNTPAGIITDGDLRRMLGRNTQLGNIQAQDIMKAAPITITSDTLAAQALVTMRAHSITQLVVADNGQYLGIIHLHDLLREGII